MIELVNRLATTITTFAVDSRVVGLDAFGNNFRHESFVLRYFEVIVWFSGIVLHCLCIT